jgi:hypothetical protein
VVVVAFRQLGPGRGLESLYRTFIYFCGKFKKKLTKIQISRMFLTGIAISLGVTKFPVSAEISEISAEKKNPWP